MTINLRYSNAAILLTALLLLAAPTWAHSVRMFVTPEGPDAWSGRVFLPGGGKVAGATVRLLAADGSQRAEMKTDADGAFRYDGKLPAGAYLFRVDLDAGHRAEWPILVDVVFVPAEAGPTEIPAGPPTRVITASQPARKQRAPDDLDARVSRAVAKEVAPLRQELAEYRSAVRTGDILAGLGAIALLAGAGFYLLARRERRRAED